MAIEKFGDLPVIETERFMLRKITSNDLDDMYAYGSNEEVSKYTTWETHKTKADTKAFLAFILQQYEKKAIAPWAIEWKKNRKMIGTIDFVSWNPKHKVGEIGYVLHQDYWGFGIMSEAAKAVITFGFEEKGLERIEAKCFVENIGSSKVMEKAGMTYEGTLRKAMYMKGKHRDVKVYSILREEFFNHYK